MLVRAGAVSLGSFLIEVRELQQQTKLRIIGIVVALGLVCASAVPLYLQKMREERIEYRNDDHTTSVKKAVQIAKNSHKDTVIVLVRKGCIYCEQAQGAIKAGTRDARQNGLRVLKIDIAKLSQTELQQLVKNVPGAEANGGIETPTMIDLRSENGKLKAVRVQRGGTNNQIKHFFNEAGE